MGQTIEYNLKIVKITETEVQNLEEDSQRFVLVAQNGENKLTSLSLRSSTEFSGFKPNQYVKVKITVDQTALPEFNKVKGNEVKGKYDLEKDLAERREVEVISKT